MKEAEIRVYDKVRDIFYYQAMHNNSEMPNKIQSILYSDGKINCIKVQREIPFIYDYINNDDFIIDYSTTLKDKNGNKLFERDIIKDSSNRTMMIEWDSRIGASGFIFKTLNEVGHIKKGRFLSPRDWITSTENDTELIGNIHQKIVVIIN